MKKDLKSMAAARQVAREGEYEQNAEKLTEEQLKRQASELSMLSEEELYSELYKNVGEAKRKGELSGEDIDGFMRMVSPMLSDEQRAKLLELAEKIR